jgi:alpha-D-ribose 1-methylphosphonate 5-triphosphate synthase subunit PhnH
MSIDLPGFADPVAGAQSCFRAVLQATSRPGSRHKIADSLRAPAPLHPATAAVMLTLIDTDTALWASGEWTAAREWIAFHCGAAFAPTADQADYVLANKLPDIAALKTGSDAGPEDSATVILQVAGFDGGRDVLLVGPGLARPQPFNVAGLPANFAAIWAANHALFPRGVDLLLCAGAEVVALPRSVSISEA